MNLVETFTPYDQILIFKEQLLYRRLLSWKDGLIGVFQTWEVWDSASTTGNEDWNKEAQLWPLILHNLEK